ncbi:MAG: hypothetical protein ACLU38_10190 [Dysosmobacter sp.]
MLKNGDIVEMLTSKTRQGPQPGLAEDLPRATRPATKIRQWFKKEKREENIATGRCRFRGGAEARAASPLKDVTGPEVLPGMLLNKVRLSARWTSCTPPSAMAASPLRRR